MKSTVGTGVREAASARMPDTDTVSAASPLILLLTSIQNALDTLAISFRLAQAVGLEQVAMEDARVKRLELSYYSVIYDCLEEMERRMLKVHREGSGSTGSMVGA